MKIRLIAGVLLMVGLASCAGRPQPRMATFVESEYAPYFQSGPCSVTGQAFVKTRGGDVKLAAGNKVILHPQTSYSREWWTRVVLAEEVLEPGDERVMKYGRGAIADANGRFKFEHLPPGDYYVACRIEWEVPSGGYLSRTGGWAHATVTVSETSPVADVVATR